MLGRQLWSMSMQQPILPVLSAGILPDPSTTLAHLPSSLLLLCRYGAIEALSRAAADGMHWLLHLDPDELLHPGGWGCGWLGEGVDRLQCCPVPPPFDLIRVPGTWAQQSVLR